MTQKKPGMAIYIHWPFCLSKCPYCDFNSHVADHVDHTAWSQALQAELEYFLDKADTAPITSVFFGGGTPSLMAPQTVSDLLDFLGLDQSVEVTLEANPTSVEIEKLKDFKSAGVNRLSMGIQSLDDRALKFLGRQHNAKEALKALSYVSETFDRYSFDLIYARPDQTLGEWKKELAEALQYAASHLSLYQLTIEKGTPFYNAYARGDFEMPNDDLAADFYDLTESMILDKGFRSYEVSNYAKPGHECLHNLAYWQYRDYIGVGPGAHGRITVNDQKYATRQHRAPSIWLDRVSSDRHATQDFDLLDVQAQLEEFVMMGLRLQQGILKADFKLVSGQDFDHFFDHKKLSALSDFTTNTPESFALNDEGRQRLNKVLEYLLV